MNDASEVLRAANEIVELMRERDPDDDCPFDGLSASMVARTALPLARHLIASVKPDDGEAVDCVWLESVGFVWKNQFCNNDSKKMLYLEAINLRYEIACIWNRGQPDESTDWEFNLGTRYGVSLPTRGDVRRLCAAIGIPLTESEVAG